MKKFSSRTSHLAVERVHFFSSSMHRKWRLADNPAHLVAKAWTAEPSRYRFWAYAAVACVLIMLPRGISALMDAIYAYMDARDMPKIRVSASFVYWAIFAVMAGDVLDTLFKRLKRNIDAAARRRLAAEARERW